MGAAHPVVVCTDCTAGPDAAAERGRRLAQGHRAMPDLLHAFDTGARRVLMVALAVSAMVSKVVS